MHSKSRLTPYVLLLPTMAIIGLFIYWPTLEAVILSFYRQAPFGRRRMFIGLNNYLSILTDPDYRTSLWLTTVFVVLVVFFGLAISFVMAALANQNLRGIQIYRTIFFVPYAISPVVAGSLWIFLLNPVAGHVNYILGRFFNIYPQWLTDTTLAFVAVTIATIWKNLGFNIIFYLAAFQSVPETIYESARIDGAGAITTFFRITVPLVSPTTFYLIIMNLIFAVFESFGIVDVMTQGGPTNATSFLVYKLYKDSFVNFRPGLAAAQSVILLLMVVVITILHFRYNSRFVHYQ
ncbi:MAG: carbohydrate ABC transporter permease [Limnochordia bacterium]|jgi:sn-glycerol 3-phosphate transport system permease protein